MYIGVAISHIIHVSLILTGGQSVASRVAKQLKATSASLRRSIKTYNDKNFSSGELPHSILYKDVVDPESAIFSNIQVLVMILIS